jgi:hypothetical protein
MPSDSDYPTGYSESNDLNRIVRIKGLKQDNQNQRAYIG